MIQTKKNQITHDIASGYWKTSFQLAVWAILAVTLSLASSLVAHAQLVNGTIAGTVVDSTGANIPKATVVVTSDTKKFKVATVMTGGTGEFVASNLLPDKYTIHVEASGFKTLDQTGIQVDPGARVALGNLTLTVGAVTEKVTVTSLATRVQSESAEQSYTIDPIQSSDLPVAGRSFTQLATLAPGVAGTSLFTVTAVGAGPTNQNANIMQDGVSTLDVGDNGNLLILPTESISEIKVLTSNYQAEFGRSSGIQISTVTKSGTDQFHGGVYDVERHSGWNANNVANIANGVSRPVDNERDWGFSIGGPVGWAGKGRTHKLFFFYTEEFNPRTYRGTTAFFRLPTQLERQGDFSQTYDNNGKLANLIRDPSSSSPCNSTNTSGCFAANGVLGKIPASNLNSLGQAILNLYPLPNLNGAGLPYNYQAIRPSQSFFSTTPVLKMDYQPRSNLRLSGKGAAWIQKQNTIIGSLPGFNDAKLAFPITTIYAATVDWTITPKTVFEFTFGKGHNHFSGCVLGAQIGPVSPYTSVAPCTNAIAMDPVSSVATDGLAGLPLLFPGARNLPSSFWAVNAYNNTGTPDWNGSQFLKAPNFSYGSLINSAFAPPNFPNPSFLNNAVSWDFSPSVTRVAGAHTLKAGFYLGYGLKTEEPFAAQSSGSYSFANDSLNPSDTGFGFANAVLGQFDNFSQLSKYPESTFHYWNIEWFLQDTWKVTPHLTLDYGLRFVHQSPVENLRNESSTFVPQNYKASAAPALYVAGCSGVIGSGGCPAANRVAINPLTGASLGSGSYAEIGTIVQGTGSATNGIISQSSTNSGCCYSQPALNLAPRVGVAYDLKGNQKYVLRGGVGIFYDRQSLTQYEEVANAPSVLNETVYYANFSQLAGSSGAGVEAAPTLSVVQQHMGVPTSLQWNAGIQTSVVKNFVLGFAYVGNHGWNFPEVVNINSVDLGSAFSSSLQDPTRAPSTIPGADAVTANQMRAITGYGAINMLTDRKYVTFHSLQLTAERRFSHGFSVSFNDTISLYDWTDFNQSSGAVPERIQHDASGAFSYRSDERLAHQLLGNITPPVHTMHGSFVYNLPRFTGGSDTVAMKGTQFLLNDWQVSGLWNGSTGAGYTVTPIFNQVSAQNFTGSPDFSPRIVVSGNPGSGCSKNAYAQFNAAAFSAPILGQSVGLDSNNNYLRGCFIEQFDTALSRNIKLHSDRYGLQLRLEAFNVLNAGAVTASNATVQYAGTSNSTFTVTNAQYVNGVLQAGHSTPNTAGFGGATAYQTPRSLQFTARFSF